MKITVIGAGNSGLAMAAHLGFEGHEVTLWNRTTATIATLIQTKTIYCQGIINKAVHINQVTDDLAQALQDPELVLITTPASSHKQLAKAIALNLNQFGWGALTMSGAKAFMNAFKTIKIMRSSMPPIPWSTAMCLKMSLAAWCLWRPWATSSILPWPTPV